MKKLNILFAVILLSSALFAQVPVTSGLVMDLDAAYGFTAIPFTVSTSSTWHSSSGLNDSVVTSLSYSTTDPVQVTIGGFPAIQFAGQSTMMCLVDTLFDTSATIFVVTTNQNYPQFSYGSPVSIADYTNFLNNEFTIDANNVLHNTSDNNWIEKSHQCIGNIDTGQIIVEAGAWHSGITNTDMDMYVDGTRSTDSLTSYGTVSPYTSVKRYIYIGARVLNQLYHPFSGNIFRILLYNTRLSEADIASVNNYLKTTYSVAKNGCIDSADAVTNISAAQSTLSVSPNPVNRELSLSYAMEGGFDAASIRVYDMLGRPVDVIAVSSLSGQKTIDMSHYAAGIYTAVLENNEHKLNSVRFVKE